MSDAWKALMDAGLPDGPPRPRPRGPLDAPRLRSVLAELAGRLDELETSQVETLRAWLEGWRHHWPRRFQEILGTAGEECRERLSHAPVDANRYLKLRRIAIDNLSHAI